LVSAVSAGIGAEFVAETGFGEQFSCGVDLVLADQDTALKSADRAFQHADISIDNQMRDIGAGEQRLDRRDQHGIIGADQLAQNFSSAVVLRRARAAPDRQSASPRGGRASRYRESS